MSTRVWRFAIVSAALTSGTLTAVSAATPVRTVQDDLPGKAPFERVCAMCHGADAKGDVGPSLVPMERDDQEVLGIVREGVGEMPPISTDTISDADVKAVVAFLKSLH